jgi:hypothetical protein
MTSVTVNDGGVSKAMENGRPEMEKIDGTVDANSRMS